MHTNSITLIKLQEYNTLYTLGATVTYDCIWVRDEMREARQYIYDYAIQPLEQYRDVITTRIWHTFLELSNIVNDINSVR